MDTNTKAAVAAGMAAGYVVGRTKKGKLALSVLSLIAGRSLNPTALIGQGVRKLAETPQFAGLSEQVRDELVGSGKTALSDISSKGVASLTAALQERTRLLLEGEEAEEAEGEAAEESEEYEEEDAEKQDEEEDETADEGEDEDE